MNMLKTKTIVKKASRLCSAMLMLLALVLGLTTSSVAQTITTSLLNNNGSSVVVFSLQNNSATSAYILTGIGSLAGFTGTGTARLYAKTATYNVAPGAVGVVSSANGWTDIGSNTALVTTSNTTATATGANATTWITGMSYSIPPLTQVRFCLQHVTSAGAASFSATAGSIRYSTVGTQICSFANGDIVLNACTNYGYGGTLASATNSPRGFVGFVNFMASSPCTGAPNPGNTVASANPVCPSSSFSLSLQNVTAGTGVTYQWESSPDNVTWNPITGATSSTYTTAITTATYYRCFVTCANALPGTYSSPVQVTMNPFTNCYCASSATSTADEEISNVTFGTLNNSSTCASVGPGPGSVNSMYSNYKSGAGAPAPAYVTQGDVVPFGVTMTTCGGNYGNMTSIFIDYNQNGLFTDAGELVYQSTTSITGNNTRSGFITIPFTATPGTTAMRVINTETTVAITSPCGTYTWGETEDYLVTIAAAIPCTGAPNPGNTTGPASTCPNVNFNLGLQNITTGVGISYQWESSPDGITWSPITGATFSVASVSQSADMYYRCLVSCSNSGLSSYSNQIVVATNGFFTCYCTPTSTYGTSGAAYGGISNVSFDAINNPTTNVPAAPYYTSYAAPTSSPMQGITYPLTVTGGGYGQYAVWIDYNHSGTFDAAEYTYLGTLSTGITPSNFSANIAIPGTALTGPTKMRIRGEAYFYTLTNTMACTTLYYGETEDYTLDIQAFIPCSGTPTPGNTIASAISVCPGVPFYLSLQNLTAGVGVTYQWESSTDPSFSTSTLLGTNATQTVSTQSVATYYRCLVTCTNGPASDYSIPVLVNQNPGNMCYCTPTYTSGIQYGDLISSVAVTGTTLSNNSGTATSPNTSYTYYDPAIYTAPNYTGTMTAGNTYNCVVAIGSFSGQGVAAWIDFNDDGFFSSTEKIGYTPTTIGTAFGTATFPIVIPCNPTPGPHRLRVRCAWVQNGPTIDPCLIYGYGEAEDYIVTIDPPLPCPAPSAFALTTGSQTSTGATFSWTIGCVETDWEIEYGPTGFAPGSGTIEPSTTNPYTAVTMACGSTYDVYLRANCQANGYSSYVGPISVTTLPCPCTGYPAQANVVAPASTCSGGTFNMSLSVNYSGLTGIAFQWESADDANFTTGLATLGTLATQSASQTAAKYYRCNVTCTASGLSTMANYAYVAMAPPTQCYCSAPSLTSADEEIFGVSMTSTVGTMNNISNCATVAPGSGSLAGQYGNYMGAPMISMIDGSTVSFSINLNACGTGTYSNGTAIFIDLNQNGSFADAGEQVFTEPTVTPTTPGVGRTVTGTFTLPVGAVIGNTGMRIMNVEGYSGTGITPCMVYYYGETEDYTVTIQASAPCAGTPAPGNTLASQSSVCAAGASVNLSLQSATPGAGVTYQWQAADDQNFTTNVQTLGTSATQSYTMPGTTTWFHCQVTCTGSGQSTWSNPVSVAVNAIPPGYNMANPIVIGAAPVGTPYTNTITNTTANCYANNLTSASNQASQDVWYQFTLACPSDVNIGLCGASFDTYLHLLNGSGTELAYNDDNGPLCSGLVSSISQTGLAAGTYYVVTEGYNTNTGALPLTVVSTTNCSVTLNLKCFIEGFYLGTNSMQPVLNNQGLPNPTTDCDAVVVELHDATSPYATAYSFSGTLLTNGNIACTFPGAALGNSYYIVVNHRNAMQTWTASPVSMTSVTAYDFSTAATQAYGANQVQMASGQFAFFSGDVNQDLSIDAFDYLIMDPDIANGNGGWLATDLNGDGSVDAFDYLIYDPNGYNGITVQSP